MSKRRNKIKRKNGSKISTQSQISNEIDKQLRIEYLKIVSNSIFLFANLVQCLKSLDWIRNLFKNHFNP